MNGSLVDGVFYLPFNTVASETYKQTVRAKHDKTK